VPRISNIPERRRVAITAMGIVSPLGAGLLENAAALREGRDCVSEVTAFDTTKCRSKTAGQVTSLPAPASKKETRLHRASHMMIHAVREMLRGDSAFVPDAMVIGTTSGGMSFGEEFYRAQVSGTRIRGRAALVANYPPQKAPMDAMEAVGFRAPLQIIANACASGANAIGHAFHLIRAGLKRRVLCGGYDAISEMVYVGFDSLQAATTEKVRPFDKARSGLVLGEGAAVLALEDFEFAKKRGAPILAEITGYGISTDNHHLTQPHPSGIGPALAMQRALEDGALKAGEVDYINAHGTATPFNDASEGAAIAKVFGARVPVSSTKAMMGHALGAAGAIEAVFGVLAIRGGFLPPNINLRERDPALDLDIVANVARKSRVDCVVSNSFGFGGTNASVVIEVVNSEGVRKPSGPFAPLGTTRDLESSHEGDKRAPLTARIAGSGCVTPLGANLGETARRLSQGEKAALSKVKQGENGRTCPAILVPAEFTAHLGREPRLRRASAISTLAAAAGNEAVAAALKVNPGMKSRLAIVFGVSSGGVQYTRRFYAQIVTQGANAASPLLFPETVYNAPASHLAAMLGVDGATYTLVGDGTVGLQALEFGAQLIATGDADAVLVVAAEEFDWILSEAHRAWRLVTSFDGSAPNELTGQGAPLAEGAAAILLSRDAGSAKVRFAEGCTHFAKSDAPEMLEQALAEVADGELPDVIVSGANGTWTDAVIERAVARHFPNSQPAMLSPKRALGECLGAGALLQVVIALEELRRTNARRALVTTLGWNQQAAAAMIERRAE
jgi:3-oxoacyl-[acyl-carrier-protein] synthase II